MPNPSLEVRLLEEVAQRDHAIGQIPFDQRVMDHLIRLSIKGGCATCYTNGSTIASAIYARPRAVSDAIQRLIEEGRLARSGYDGVTKTWAFTVVGLMDEASRLSLAVADPTLEPVLCEAPVEIPDDWAPSHWLDVFGVWGSMDDLRQLSPEQSRGWGQVMAHIDPTLLTLDVIRRGQRIPKPLKQALERLFTWDDGAPRLRPEYIKPGLAPPKSGEEKLIQPHEHTNGAIPKPIKQPAKPKPEYKKKEEKPPPPEGYVPTPITPERREAWEEFLGEVGESLDNAPKVMGDNALAMLMEFVATHEPKQLRDKVKYGLIAGVKHKAGEGPPGILYPFSYIISRLYWKDGQLKVKPELAKSASKPRALSPRPPREEQSPEDKERLTAKISEMSATLFGGSKSDDKQHVVSAQEPTPQRQGGQSNSYESTAPQRRSGEGSPGDAPVAGGVGAIRISDMAGLLQRKAPDHLPGDTGVGGPGEAG